MAEYDFRWVTAPPVKEIGLGEAVKYAKQMLASVNDWRIDTTGRTPTTDESKWNNRIGSAAELLGYLMTKGRDTYLVYIFLDQPIGLMSVKDKGWPEIEELVTHPGTAYAGATLIECAVNKSAKEWSYKGLLKLYSLNNESSQFYLHLGFKYTSGSQTSGAGNMKLEPWYASDVWANVEGVWKLKSYEKLQKFLVGDKKL